MAKIKLGPNVLDMRGRIGQLVYSIWKGGTSYVRQAVEVVRNPSSPGQNKVRALIRILSSLWKALPESNQAQWGVVAQSGATRKNSEGGIRALIRTPNGKMTGFNAFIVANELARSVGATTTIEAPQGHVPAPNSPPDLALAFDGDKITVTWSDIEGVMPSQFVRVWIYSEQRKFHRQMIDFAPGAAKTMNITEFRAENGTPVEVATLLNSAV